MSMIFVKGGHSPEGTGELIKFGAGETFFKRHWIAEGGGEEEWKQVECG